MALSLDPDLRPVLDLARQWDELDRLAERAKARVAVHDLDPHAAFLPELGLTMADGGEKVDEDEEKK